MHHGFKRARAVSWPLLICACLLTVGVSLLAYTRAGAQENVHDEDVDFLDVCPAGCPYDSIQAAVDAAAPGDVVRVAVGIYTDLHARGQVTQVVYISKSVTIRGGYSLQFTDPPNPTAYPTVLDARGQGRVFFITGDIHVTLQGLRLTGGHIEGDGGGLRASGANVVLEQVEVRSNEAHRGGGLYFDNCQVRLWSSLVQDNQATGNGGGLYLYNSPAVLARNRLLDNGSGEDGGGIYMLLQHLYLANNVIAHNRADGRGSGIFLAGDADMIHNTLARNGGPAGQGLYQLSNTARLTNTIIVDHPVGIFVAGSATVNLEATFWGHETWANGTNYIARGTIETGTIEISAAPGFRAPDAGDYHLTESSSALDVGIQTAVTRDLDGEERPFGPAVDMGADEYHPGPAMQPASYLPLIVNRRSAATGSQDP